MKPILTLGIVILLLWAAAAEVAIEKDIMCEDRPNPMLVYLQSKTTGIAYHIRTIDDTGEIILWGNFESSKGIGSKLNSEGVLQWGYTFPLPCEVLMLDSKQENAMMVLRYPSRGMEIHNYQISDGSKNYIYEYQISDILSFQDGAYANDYFWFVGYTTSGNWFILKMSETRRYTYKCPSSTKIWSIVFPAEDPVFVGNSAANKPFLIQIGSADFTTSVNVQLDGVLSKQMNLRNRFEEDVELTWALSEFATNKLFITQFNSNTTSLVWSKSYDLYYETVNIVYNTVFEDYILAGNEPTNNRACFLRFSRTNGAMNFLKCNKIGSGTTYNIYTSTLHVDTGSSIYIGGRLSGENFFYYRTGIELGDNSCPFNGSVLYNASDYSYSGASLSLSDLNMTMTSYLCKYKLNILFYLKHKIYA